MNIEMRNHVPRRDLIPSMRRTYPTFTEKPAPTPAAEITPSRSRPRYSSLPISQCSIGIASHALNAERNAAAIGQ